MNVKIKNYLLVYLLPITLFALLLYLKFYADGSIILGGEGNFIIDFELHKKVYGSTWFDIGYGWPNIIPNPIGINHYILNAVGYATNNFRLTNYLLILSLYTLPYIAMAGLILAMKMKILDAFLIGSIYVINPFTISYLQGLNQWNNFSIVLIPLLILIYLKINRLIYIFILTGIVTRLFSFSLYNPPTAAIVVLVILIGPLLVISVKDKRLLLTSASGILGFTIFNLDWLSILIYSMINGVTDQIITKEFSVSWVSVVSSAGLGAMYEIMSLNSLQNKSGSNYSYYSSTFVSMANIIAYSAILLVAILKKNTKLKMLAGLILLTTWLAKGVAYPFGELYYLLIEYFPFFYIFKTPTEKFGILLIFLLVFTMAHNIKDLSTRTKTILLSLYFIIYLFPLVNGDAIASSYMVDKRVVSRKIFFDEDKISAIKFLNKYLNNEIIMTYPGSGNYQAMIKYGKIFYTGLDPVLNNSNIRYIYPDLDKQLYSLPVNQAFKIELRKRNIGGIVFNSNEEYWFGSSYDGKKESVLMELNPLFGDPIEVGGYYVWVIR